MLPHEVALLKVLAKRLGVREKPVFERLATGFYRWIIREYCPFYDATGRSCLIHSDKPLACRMYPLIVNLSTMELSVSRICTWVSRNQWLVEHSVEDPSAVFPEEMKAVRELFEILGWAAESGLVVVIAEKIDNKLSRLVEKPCKLVRIRECGSARGLYILFLTGCTSDDAERVLGSSGLNVVAVAEIAAQFNQQY